LPALPSVAEALGSRVVTAAEGYHQILSSNFSISGTPPWKTR
jgi:hypothetical protein